MFVKENFHTHIFFPEDSEFESYAWDNSIMAMMDAGCLSFIVQTSDVTYMVQTFARVAHSPRSMYRSNRKFFYIPSIEIPDDVFETEIKKLFSMREIDFMPDLVVAKFIREQNITSDVNAASTENIGREIYYRALWKLFPIHFHCKPTAEHAQLTRVVAS